MLNFTRGIELQYYSQLGQDKFIDEYFQEKKEGIFVDIGAHDGIRFSNTYFFEKYRGWTGLCVEPGPKEFKNLCLNRPNSINVNACVSNYNGSSMYNYIEGYSMMLSGLIENYDSNHKQRIKNEIEKYEGKFTIISSEVYALQYLLEKHNILKIDYCSIDTEGSELKILESIDFEKSKIQILNLENNYKDERINQILSKNSYKLIKTIGTDYFFESTLL